MLSLAGGGRTPSLASLVLRAAAIRRQSGRSGGGAGELGEEELIGFHRSARKWALRGAPAKSSLPTSPAPVLAGSRLARLSTVKYKAECLQRMTDLYSTDVRRMYGDAPGFEGAHLMLDQSSGKVVSLTVWSSMRQMDHLASTDNYKRTMTALGHCFEGTPEVQTFNLLATLEGKQRVP